MSEGLRRRFEEWTTRVRQIGSRPQSPLTVLIVDDEEPVREFVERVLRTAGYVTAVASDGVEAMQVTANIGPVDVLVTDMVMPEMTGDELARRLRCKRPELKVLYFTGFSDRLFDEKGSMWLDEAFVEKPCGVKGLLEAVSLLWSRHLDTPPTLASVP
jgi:CheY-like chemotaxis protein